MDAATLLGAVLSFSDPSGQMLTLEVLFSQPSTVALDWGARALSSTGSARLRHRFGPFAVPRGTPLRYRVRGPGGSRLEATIPDYEERPLRVAILGGAGEEVGSSGVLEGLLHDIRAWRPHLVVALETHPPRPSRTDPSTLTRHASLAEGRPFESLLHRALARGGSPLLAVAPGGPRAQRAGRRRKTEPGRPVSDTGVQEAASGMGFVQLRLGPAVLIGLDSGRALAAQLDPRAIATVERPLRFAFMPWGPLSSGPRGPHPEGEALLARAADIPLTAVFSAQDHLYERFGRGMLTCVVTGGGGGPLDLPSRISAGSASAVAAHHYIALHIFERFAELEARTLDGLVLDRVRLPPPHPVAPSGRLVDVVLTLILLLGSVGFALHRLLRPLHSETS